MAVPKRLLRFRFNRFLRRFLLLFFSFTIGCILLSILSVAALRWMPPITSSFMLQSFMTPPIRPYAYTWVPYDRISPYMPLAAIAAEDQRFPAHNGFDWDALQQAVTDYEQGGELRGASTISQQVAKNLYLWPDRSFIRKGLEAWFTVLLETFWSKQRILEIYLNIAEFGDHIYGVEAASQQFFGIAANDLSPEESALLAAVLPGPQIYFVDSPSTEVWQSQGWILQQMEQLGGLEYLGKL